MSINLPQLHRRFGDEYPAAIVMDGIRIPLTRERRFSRSYHSREHKTGSEISRFMDGSASITATELEREWPGWSDDERNDFCQSCGWLSKQSDFPDMLRYIMQRGDSSDWCGVAMSVAYCLPQQEAFEILVRALQNTDIHPRSNLAQAIALTKHPDAEATLRKRLAGLWDCPTLWENADFTNWIAFDATTCIAHLIELGAPPFDFTEHAEQLSQHVCENNRKSCRNYLSKHYSWLKTA